MPIDCDECTEYGYDYYIDEDGEFVSWCCDDCPNNTDRSVDDD